jgi:hypothetical protein
MQAYSEGLGARRAGLGGPSSSVETAAWTRPSSVSTPSPKEGASLLEPQSYVSVASHLFRNKGFRGGHADLTKWVGV